MVSYSLVLLRLFAGVQSSGSEPVVREGVEEARIVSEHSVAKQPSDVSSANTTSVTVEINYLRTSRVFADCGTEWGVENGCPRWREGGKMTHVVRLSDPYFQVVLPDSYAQNVTFVGGHFWKWAYADNADNTVKYQHHIDKWENKNVNCGSETLRDIAPSRNRFYQAIGVDSKNNYNQAIKGRRGGCEVDKTITFTVPNSIVNNKTNTFELGAWDYDTTSYDDSLGWITLHYENMDQAKEFPTTYPPNLPSAQGFIKARVTLSP